MIFRGFMARVRPWTLSRIWHIRWVNFLRKRASQAWKSHVSREIVLRNVSWCSTEWGDWKYLDLMETFVAGCYGQIIEGGIKWYRLCYSLISKPKLSICFVIFLKGREERSRRNKCCYALIERKPRYSHSQLIGNWRPFIKWRGCMGSWMHGLHLSAMRQDKV